MTIREAMQKNLERVRLPIWASPGCYLLLSKIPGGGYGPWARLFDDRQQTDMGIEPGSQRILILDIMDHDGFEEYQGEISTNEPRSGHA